MLGILVIDKPTGISSHDVVNSVRRTIGVRRVGHAGTLDPLATGVLVLAVGPATRFLQYLSLEPKVYECRAKFGVSTNTQDSDGEILETRDVRPDLAQIIEQSIASFVGELSQIPPAYSAIKINGKPLYKYAREGQTIEAAPRTVYVHAIDVLSCRGDVADLRIACSGGTYIRTLVHDLGQKLGCGAHVVALRRTAVGGFDLTTAVPLTEVRSADLISLHDAVAPMPILKIGPDFESAFRNGMTVSQSVEFDAIRVAVEDGFGRVFAIANVGENQLSPICIIPSEAFDEPL